MGPDGTLGIAMVQWASTLEPGENRDALSGLDVQADLVVLPEAFARDFGPVDDDLGAYAEPLDGPFARCIEELADGRTVVAGMFERSADLTRPFNTLLVRGEVEATYRKIHLYDSFGYKESDRLTAGPWEPAVVDLNGLRIGLMTCYDLRFPELARALVDHGAHLIVVPAAWVAGRTPEEHERKRDHWRTLVRARAIENTAYVVAVGQPGPRYTGRSLAVDPMGEVLAEAGDDAEVLNVQVARAVVEEARVTNPSVSNRRADAK